MRKLLLRTINHLSKWPLIGSTFRTYLAAAAVGESSRAIKAENFDYAFHVVQRFEQDEIEDSYLSHCQYFLGYLLFRGLGTEKDVSRAIGIFERAASNGSSDAIDYMRQRAKALKSGKHSESIYPTL